MRRLTVILLALAVSTAAAFSQTIRVTTWNLEWFPGGSMKGATPAVEAANIKAAADVLALINPDVILLQEVRDEAACQRLADAIPAANYEVAVCSAFRDEITGGAGRQQVAILTKKPADTAWAERWKTTGRVDPPRGYAYAVVPFGKRLVGFYSLHLKSNLVRNGSEREPQVNIVKRELAAEQVVSHSVEVAKKYPAGLAGIIVGGDFNTNRDQPLFISERTLTIFTNGGFMDPLASLPLARRITHPGKGGLQDAPFDYVLCKGLKIAGAPELLKTKVSDHFPVTCEFEFPK